MTRPVIEALPGKVILEFPARPQEKIGSLYVPQRSARKREFARLVHCGEASNAEERVRRLAIIEAASRGLLFAIPISSGQPCYQIELETDADKESYGTEKDQDLGAFDFLKSLRTYSMTQLHSVIADPDTMAQIEAQQ